jgi:hypothetical protein
LALVKEAVANCASAYSMAHETLFTG